MLEIAWNSACDQLRSLDLGVFATFHYRYGRKGKSYDDDERWSLSRRIAFTFLQSKQALAGAMISLEKTCIYTLG